MRTSSLSRCLGISLASVVAFGIIATPAAAQTMKPGLWEINNKMGGSGDTGAKMAAAQAEMQKQMAAIPPEQRKQMEKMMAQQGVNMAPSGAGGGMAVRVCITKEMAARNETPTQGDCKQEQLQKSGNTTKFKFTCSKPPSSGEGEVTMNNPESYTMKMKMTSQEKGKPEQMTMDAQGKFVSSDCGSVKPIASK